MSAPVQMLEAYSRNQVGMDDVMRALTSHRGWFAPLGLFAQEEGGETNRRVDSLLVLSTEARITPGELWIFTDREAALRAQAAGAALGSYAGGMAGTELFRNVPANTTTVRVNPGSAREQTWTYMAGGGIEAGKIWADAIALEDSFEHWQQSGTPDKTAFINYRAFLTFDHASGPVVTLPGSSGMSNPAAAFTTPDCAEMFLSKLEEAQRATLQRVTISGNTLLEKAAVLGIDGLVINLFGPGATCALPFAALDSHP